MRDRVISRKFHVRDAAESFAHIARTQGGMPNAYVRTLYTNRQAPVAA